MVFEIYQKNGERKRARKTERAPTNQKTIQPLWKRRKTRNKDPQTHIHISELTESNGNRTKTCPFCLMCFYFIFFFLLCPFAFFKRARCFSPLKRFFFSTFASSTFETQLWNELIKADQNCFFFLHNEKRFHFAHFCYFALPLMHTISWRKKKYCEEKRTIHLIADCVKMENNLTPFESL